MSKETTESPQSLNAYLNLYDEDGNIQFDKDREAARQYFLQHVNKNTVYFNSLEEKLEYLVENDYYEEEFLDNYSSEFIKQLYKDLYNEKHRFKAYLSALKFYNQYTMKTRDGSRYLERWEDRCAAVGLYLGQGDEELAHNIAMMHLKGQFQTATPTFMNCGKKSRGNLVSCFLLNVFDNTESIGRTINSALALSRAGGGVGLNISNLREAGAPIQGIEGAASGVIPFMKTAEDTICRYFNQLGQRQGSAVAYLNILHPDLLDFIDTKRENADEAIRMKVLSTGLIIPDIVMQKAAKNEDIYFISPYELERATGQLMSDFDFTARYNELIENPEISKKKKMNARALLSRIAEVQAESGYPYMMFIDQANRSMAVDGRIGMSNLCSEILQPQSPSTYNPDFTYDHLGKDISCNLGSVIVDGVMDSDDPAAIIGAGVRALTQVSDMTIGTLPYAPTVDNGNQNAHSIGLSAMNLHGYFAREHIKYGSPESIEFVSAFFMAMRYYVLKESNKIAQERNKTFTDFDKSKYATGEFFDKYLNNDYLPTTPKIVNLFGEWLPSKEDWKQLKENVMDFGLYNRELLCEPPTGSISYVQSSTNSIMPVPGGPVETRFEGNRVGRVYYPQPYANQDNLEYFESAYDLGYKKIIDVVAAAQEHIDQGISMNLFFDKRNSNTRDINKAQIYAWKKGLKTIYYTRFRQAALEGTEVDCVSCSL